MLTDRKRAVSLIDRAEQLKTELTDKWVVVSAASPELKRFAALTGRVRTVNMNCRALVEFDNGIDIGWYDIDPGFLTVVDGPRPKVAAEKAEKAEKPARAAAAAPATAAPAAAGGSAMDKIRAAAGKPAAAPAAAPAAGGSPLDKIRAAGAKPAAAPAPAGGGSPLDKIRAAKKPAAEVEPAVPEPAAANAAVSAPAAPVAPAAAAPLTGSPLDRIRAQGAVKK